LCRGEELLLRLLILVLLLRGHLLRRLLLVRRALLDLLVVLIQKGAQRRLLLLRCLRCLAILLRNLLLVHQRVSAVVLSRVLIESAREMRTHLLLGRHLLLQLLQLLLLMLLAQGEFTRLHWVSHLWGRLDLSGESSIGLSLERLGLVGLGGLLGRGRRVLEVGTHLLLR
jgi:hypothetical protein